uniref:Suf domain-containing protein n=1 Tax=Macrostomum lignano TaxID=282301 RepID=A0A1I8FGN9_9PLAT
WHVFGLLQRAERKYDGSYESFTNALYDLKSDNMQILRDFVSAADGYRDTPLWNQLLLLRPATESIFGLDTAMSFHLLGDYEWHWAILKEYCKTQKPSSHWPTASCARLFEHDANIMDRTYTKEVRAPASVGARPPVRRSCCKPSGPVERMAIYADLRKTHRAPPMPDELDNYLRQSFHKGVRNCCSDWLKACTTSLAKPMSRSRLVEGYRPPSTLVWVWYYLAQHYSKLGRPAEALRGLNRSGYEHTPTPHRASTLSKAKSSKGRRRYVSSLRIFKRAQSLDTADRYVNSVCARYLIQAGRMEEAEQFSLVGLLGRAQIAGEHLPDMQCMWYPDRCEARRFLTNAWASGLLDALADDSVGKNDGLSAGEAKKAEKQTRESSEIGPNRSAQKREQEQAARLAARKAHNKEHDADSDANAFKEEALDPESWPALISRLRLKIRAGRLHQPVGLLSMP